MNKENFTPENIQAPSEDQLKKDYEKAMKIMDVETVENILNKMMELNLTMPRRYDHLQRDLFKMYRDNGGEPDKKGMSRIIAATKEYQSQEGRIKNYKHVTGEEYSGFRLEAPKVENSELVKITNTHSFWNAIDAGQLESAEKWFEENKNNKKYDDRWRRHREKEIEEAKKNKK